MKNNINTKELIKGISVIFSYFIIPSILFIPFYFLYNKNIISLSIANISLYFLIALFYSLIYHKDLIANIKDFKKNYQHILKITCKYWLKGFFIMIASSFIIGILHIDANANQEANISLLKEMPIVEIICACIFAPIAEELVFRRSLKNMTNNKHLFTITTGLLFGFVHVYSSLSGISSLVMLIYLIPYSALGICFGYAYKETNNILGTMLIHSIHNTISLAELLLIGCLL